MRILLAANASYVPPRGGATRSNIAWMEMLSAYGHECRIVGAQLADNVARGSQINDEGIPVELLHSGQGHETVRRGSLVVHSAVSPFQRGQILRSEIQSFQPDWVLVSSEDLEQRLLGEASRHAPGRVIYLAHTPQFLPFGPESWVPSREGADLVRQAAGVVVISRHMAGYVERHLGRLPEIVHPPIYGSGPWPMLARFDEGLITFLNPCTLKGMPVFLEVVRRLPGCQFGVVPGWGTTAADRRILEALPNVTVLTNRGDIEEILRVTRVLLMPSLWHEGFGLIVMEAMLRGIPVVASDAGGLVEAKAGTGFVIPTQHIERYESVYDECSLPHAVVPEQDAEPWVDAVQTLTGNRSVYTEESSRSREAASRFVNSLDCRALETWLTALRTRRRLRILLAHNSPYYPAYGGGDKSNRLLVEALAERGHLCRVVARLGSFGDREHAEYVADLRARDVTILSSGGGVVVFRFNAVEIHVLTGHEGLRAYFSEQLRGFEPDIVITSTDDPAQLMLLAGLEHRASRVVYLARATLAVPFGPDSAFPNAAARNILARADGFVGVSQYVADYLRKFGEIDAVHVPISLMEAGPRPPALGRLQNEFIVIVNPCAVKGIEIFLALADRMPEVQFAAVPTWGTTAEDRRALEARPNVTVLPPVDDINRLFNRTRVLLVPSLWAEARSRIVVEAMLRGIPVIASQVGGIPEAKLNVPYLLPVTPIERYRHELDEHMVPVAEVPPQDIEPWERTLRQLLDDPAHYEEISRASREAALRYTDAELTIEPFEHYLYEILKRPRRGGAVAKAPVRSEPTYSAVEKLSPERRMLMALRLRKGKGSDAWFPGVEKGRGRRLFCFPHAGGGASAFMRWPVSGFRVCPVRLPGRESRLAEPPFERMDMLLDAVGEAIQPHLDGPFAFLGHSMGAFIAFELARWLRRHTRHQASALFVSAARAPHRYRHRGHSEDLDETQMLNDLRQLGGVPSEVMDWPEMMRLLLPALRADIQLFRHYIYSEESPLGCPIRAYSGEQDSRIRAEDLAEWASQTTASFAFQRFSGGRFYLQANQEFLNALTRDMEALC